MRDHFSALTQFLALVQNHEIVTVINFIVLIGIFISTP